MLNLAMAFSLMLLSPPPDVVAISESVLRHKAPPSSDAGRTYQELRALSANERIRLFAELPSSMQSAVLAHHLLTALAEHPEFTSEQRAVIQEALSLITPELFEIDPSNPQWGERVDQPLRRFKQRARAVFDSKTARELFTRLGPAEPAHPSVDMFDRNGDPMSAPGTALRRPNHATSLDSVFPECECSVISDWCVDWSGLGVTYCSNLYANCWFRNRGCGTLLQYACNGMCRTRPT